MIVNKIENFEHCVDLRKYEKEILEFIEKDKAERIPDGKYELDGENLFVLVQCYETASKEGKYMEAHKIYADLQYMSEGSEIIYWDLADELKVREDRTPGSDILFYENRPEKGKIYLTPGVFGVFYPEDAHMPCVAVENPEKCRKLVFKIKVK